MVRVNVNQFYGIEIEEFPVQIARTAMWLMDHLMNNAASAAFGKYIVRIPLTTAATIIHENALPLDWGSLITAENAHPSPLPAYNYILGNPPFLGARVMDDTQKKDLQAVFQNAKNCANLDYVASWYRKAAEYIQGTDIECAFVSTNSVTQGEQVPILWPILAKQFGIKINFAHRTFKWGNEHVRGQGQAAVYCVIIGFGAKSRPVKKLYSYAGIAGKPSEAKVKQINAYLVDAPMVYIDKRSQPLCDVPEMVFGSMPNDGGNFLLSAEEKNALLVSDPSVSDLIRPFAGAREYLRSIESYCIWLNDIPPTRYKHNKEIMRRIEAVKESRQKSARAATVKLASFPTLFGEIRQPESDYLLFPRVSSENRPYIPIAWMDKNTIAGDTCTILPGATLYHFGVLTSSMHMAWMRAVCGRLELRYRYSNTIVYNNFPWASPGANQKAAIEKAAQEVLDVRAKHPGLSLADLYDTTAIMPALLKAHQKLDRAVEKAYRREAFQDDSERAAYLFELYHKLTGGLFTQEKKKGLKAAR
jgi:hypothetical protein